MANKTSNVQTNHGLKLNLKRTFIIGLAFFGILLLWQVYDANCPILLTELFMEYMPQAEQESEVQYLVGVIMALDNLAALILLPIFGHLSDKTKTPIGKRMPYILVGTLVSAIAFPFIPLCFYWNNLAGMVSVMGIVVIFMMMYRNPAVALMPDITPKPLRAKANGIINIMGYLGGACATVLGLFLIVSDFSNPDSGWAYQNIWVIELPFLIASILMVITCLVLFFKIKELPLEKELARDMEEGEKESEVDASTVGSKEKMSKKNLITLILILAAEVCWFMCDNGLNTYLGNYLVYYMDTKSSMASTIVLIGGVASVIGFAVGGIIADKISRKWTIFLGLALYFVAVFWLCFVRPNGIPEGQSVASLPWDFYPIWIIKGFGIALVNTCSYPMVVELSTKDKVGKFTGYYYAASMSAQTLTSVLLGLLLFAQSWWSLPVYCTVFIGLSLLIFFFVRSKRKVNKETKALEGK